MKVTSPRPYSNPQWKITQWKAISKPFHKVKNHFHKVKNLLMKKWIFHCAEVDKWFPTHSTRTVDKRGIWNYNIFSFPEELTKMFCLRIIAKVFSLLTDGSSKWTAFAFFSMLKKAASRLWGVCRPYQEGGKKKPIRMFHLNEVAYHATIHS